MARPDGTLSGRSQNSTSAAADVVVVDRQTLTKLMKLLIFCADQLDETSKGDIMLYSLQHYLTEKETPDPGKAVLLVNYWLETAPEVLEELSSDLREGGNVLQMVLDASQLGQ